MRVSNASKGIVTLFFWDEFTLEPIVIFLEIVGFYCRIQNVEVTNYLQQRGSKNAA